jgi:hypothetical protein
MAVTSIIATSARSAYIFGTYEMKFFKKLVRVWNGHPRLKAAVVWIALTELSHSLSVDVQCVNKIRLNPTAVLVTDMSYRCSLLPMVKRACWRFEALIMDCAVPSASLSLHHKLCRLRWCLSL